MKTLLVFHNHILGVSHYYLLPEATFTTFEPIFREAHGKCLNPYTPEDSALSFISVATTSATYTPESHPFYRYAECLVPFEVHLDELPLEGVTINRVLEIGME